METLKVRGLEQTTKSYIASRNTIKHLLFTLAIISRLACVQAKQGSTFLGKNSSTAVDKKSFYLLTANFRDIFKYLLLNTSI